MYHKLGFEMTDNQSTDQASAEGNQPVYGVGEISQALKRTVEGAFSHVRVRGEISGLTRAASGHIYLSLKDADAVLDGVCWRGTAGRLKIAPEDGMEVIASGRLSTYPGRSRYQIIIDGMELAGEGALLKMLEERRRKLLAEGLFDAERKKDLPYLPEVIGVITSPTGAVIRDILHRLGDRFPSRVMIWPVIVQGEAAAAQVAAAIAGFNSFAPDGPVPRPDLLIVARGGGSLEDLWAFNEEVVVRAAAASEIPLISAIGHETDTTLIDFAADLRAPTPSAAAEMAVPVRAELIAGIADHGARLTGAISRRLERERTRLAGLARGLPEPRRLTEEATQRLDDKAGRLANAPGVLIVTRAARLQALAGGLISPARQIAERAGLLAARAGAQRSAMSNYLAARISALDGAGRLLGGLSYERVLERGFALVTEAGSAAALTSVSQAPPGTELGVRFRDGRVAARVVDQDGQTKKKPRTKKPPPDDAQGSLL